MTTNNFWDDGEHQQYATNGSDPKAVVVYLFLAVGLFLIAVSRCFA